MGPHEPRQVRKEAALREIPHVPRGRLGAVVRRSKGKTSLLHREKAFLVSHERAFPHHRAPLSPRRTQGLRGRNDYRTAGGMTHGIYRTLSEMAAEDLRRPRRAGACLQDALAGHRLGAHRPRLPLRGAARHRQDEHGEDPRQGAQLRARADARAVRHLRQLPQDHRRLLDGRLRDRRGVEPRHRRDPRPARDGEIRARRGPLQGLHHRRGAHAHGGGF